MMAEEKGDAQDKEVPHPYEPVERIPAPEGWKPELVFPEGHRWAGKPRCLQWITKRGRQCSKMPSQGRCEHQHPADKRWKSKCRSHGGSAVHGIAHYNYKHGLRVRVTRKSMTDVFDAAMADTNLLDMQRDIAFLEMRLFEISKHIAGEKASPWEMFTTLRDEWTGLEEAEGREDSRDVVRHRKKIEAILESSAGLVELWDEYLRTSEQKRKMSETEQKRREKMQFMVMVEDAMADYTALGGAVVRVLMRHAPELPEGLVNVLRSEIADEFEAVITAPLSSGDQTIAGD